MKKFFFSTLACIAMLTLTTGCSDDDDKVGGGDVPMIQTETGVYLNGAGGECVLAYKIINAIKDEEIKATTEESWISEFNYDQEGAVKFIYDPLEENAKSRTGTITLTYAQAKPVKVSLIQTKDKLSFEVSIDPESISQRGCTIHVVPSNNELPYMLAVVTKDVIDAYNFDDEFIEADILYWKTLAESQGATLKDALKTFTTMGENTRTFSDLKPSTEYYCYLYGITYEGEVLSKLYKIPFTTTDVEHSDCTFKLTYSQESAAPYGDNNVYNVKVTITPSNPNAYWTYAPMNTYVYTADQWTDEEYEKFIREHISEAKPTMFQGEMTLYLHQMLGGIRVWGGAEYFVWLFGTDERYNVNTDIQKVSIKTNEIPVTDDCTFDIQFQHIGSEEVDFTVTPTKDDTKYFIGLYPGGMINKYGANACAERMLQRIDLGHFNDEGEETNWETCSWIHRGKTIAKLAKDEGWKVEPNKDQSLIVFGFDSHGHRTTEIAVKDFTTTEYTPTENFKIDFEVVELGVRTVEVNVIPSDEETWYHMGMTNAENFDQYDGDWHAFLDALIHSNGSTNLPTTVGPDVIKSTVTPGTELVLYGFAYAEGKPQSEFFSKRITSKELPRNYNIDVDAKWGVYRGSELAELHPDVYGEYANEAYVFVFELLPKNAETVHYYGLLHASRSQMALSDMLIFDYFENYPLGWKDSKLGRYRAPGAGPFGFFWAGQDAEGAWGTLHYEELTFTQYNDAKDAPVGDFINKKDDEGTASRVMVMPIPEPQLLEPVGKTLPQAKEPFKEVIL